MNNKQTIIKIDKYINIKQIKILMMDKRINIKQKKIKKKFNV